MRRVRCVAVRYPSQCLNARDWGEDEKSTVFTSGCRSSLNDNTRDGPEPRQWRHSEFSRFRRSIFSPREVINLFEKPLYALVAQPVPGVLRDGHGVLLEVRCSPSEIVRDHLCNRASESKGHEFCLRFRPWTTPIMNVIQSVAAQGSFWNGTGGEIKRFSRRDRSVASKPPSGKNVVLRLP
jgi:hypothetical protein